MAILPNLIMSTGFQLSGEVDPRFLSIAIDSRGNLDHSDLNDLTNISENALKKIFINSTASCSR